MLIPEEYRKNRAELHRDPDFGVACVHYASIVAEFLKQVESPELLDYGAGKGLQCNTLKALLPTPRRPSLTGASRMICATKARTVTCLYPRARAHRAGSF